MQNMVNQFSIEIGGVFTHVTCGPYTVSYPSKMIYFQSPGDHRLQVFFSVMTSDPSSGFRLVTFIYWKQHMSSLTIVFPRLLETWFTCSSIFLGLTIWNAIDRLLFGQRFLGPSWNPDFLTHPHLGPFALDFRSRVLGAQFTIFLLHMYWFGMIIKIGTYYRRLVGNW